MPRKEIDNLVATGHLKTEPANAVEFAGLVESATARLRDAERTTNALESRRRRSSCRGGDERPGYRPDKQERATTFVLEQPRCMPPADFVAARLRTRELWVERTAGLNLRSKLLGHT